MGYRFRLSTALALLVLSTPGMVSALAQTPSAVAQRPPSVAADFDYFLQRLSPYGRWLRHPVWGDVWQPDAGPNFRPYFYGYWQYTSDYGWLWVSNEPYGDIVYHYGRWAYDPNFGWIWVPGYVWGPSWVAWRDTGDYIGWLPMPPGYQDFSLGNLTPSYNPGDWYGYQYFYGNNLALDAFAGLWLFVPNQDFGRRDRRPYVFDKDKVRDLYRRSHDRTHYQHDRDHDRVVDRSIDKDELERATHRSFGAQEGRQFLRRDTPITSVTEGQEIARRSRDRGRGDRLAPGFDPGANPPAPGAMAPVGAAQTGVGPADAPGPRRVGRGLFAVPPNPGTPVIGAQDSPPAATVLPDATTRSQTGTNLRARGRGFFGRPFPAVPGQPAPAAPLIAPSTDGVAGARGGNALPGVAAPAAQQPAASPVVTTPSGVRVRRFGGSPLGIAVPNVAAIAPPAAPIAPAPVMAPPVGLQMGLGAPTALAAPALPSVPPPAVHMPQAAPPAPQPPGRQFGRGLMGGLQAP